MRDNLGLFAEMPFTIPEPELSTSDGYNRYKLVGDTKKEVIATQDGQEIGRKTVIPLDFCEGKILKYLNHNGQYRFYPFNV